MLNKKRIVIIGGTSGIGLETASQALALGAEVVVASRSVAKGKAALERLHAEASQVEAEAGAKAGAEAHTLDMSDEAQIRGFFEKIGPFDHLVVTAAETSGGPFLTGDTQAARALFDGKFWGQYYAAKHGAPRIREGGSITLFSGVVAFKAMLGSSMLGAVNAAVANLGRTLALELAPLRVNVVSPGIIDTPSRSGMAEEDRRRFYESVAGKLPVGEVGQAEDVARGVLYLIGNRFVTGTVLHVDGGHPLA